MAGYDYAGWLDAVNAALSLDLVDPTSAAPFQTAPLNAFMPRAIEYAEQRIYRELDLLSTRVTDPNGVTVPNARSVTLPVTLGRFIVLEQVKITIGATPMPPLLPVSKEALEAMWPYDVALTVPSIPVMWCPVDQVSILVAPAPDAAYPIECFGTMRPAPLSSSNTSTFLTSYLPDLFFAATMVSWTGFQRDWGAQSDDPKLALSWETAYGNALKSAGIEEVRAKIQSTGWGTRMPSPLASPAQT